MKIDIVYTTKSKYIKCVADEMARWVKTYAQDLNHYHSDHDVDLLVIGFDDTLFEDKQLLEFIQSLSRQNVKNLALINCFFKIDESNSSLSKSTITSYERTIYF